MRLITEKIINIASNEVDDLLDDKMDELINIFSSEQPFIMVYLMAIDYEVLNQDERELLFFLGFKIWLSIKKANVETIQIEEEDINKIEEINEKMLEYFAGENEHGFTSGIKALFDGHNQIDLMSFAISSIMEISEEEDIFENDNSRGALFIHLKTIIECFDECCN